MYPSKFVKEDEIKKFKIESRMVLKGALYKHIVDNLWDLLVLCSDTQSQAEQKEHVEAIAIKIFRLVRPLMKKNHDPKKS